MPDAAPNRKWFQFSLRLLLLVVVAGNVFYWTSLHIRASHDEARIWRERAQEALLQEALVHTEVRKAADAFHDAAMKKYRKRHERPEPLLVMWSYFQVAKSLYQVERALNPDDHSPETFDVVLEFDLWQSAFELENNRPLNDVELENAALRARLKACGCADE